MDIIQWSILIAAVVALSYRAMVHMKKEQKKRYERKLGSRHKTKQVIDDLRVNTCLNQVLIWESYNGNGIASFGNKLKISVVDQSREMPFRDVYQDFQDLQIYGDAIDIMIQMQQNSSTARFMHDLDHGIYKRIFEGEGAFWTEWHQIGPSKDKTFFFMSISTAEQTTPYQEGQGGKIDIAINALRNQHLKLNNKPFRRFTRSFYS